MTIEIWIGLIGLPFAAAIQRYAVSYGYEGSSKETARRDATTVFCCVVIIELMLGVLKWVVT